jgi:DHA1 family tetracycline resistance protein-like MFS transporter
MIERQHTKEEMVMTGRQIAGLFLSSLNYYIVGSAIMSLLPLYMQQLGASPAELGMALAVAFAALAVSSYGSGWLSQRFRRHKPFMLLAAVLSVPVVVLMGQAQDVLQLTLGVTALWFLFGLGTAMIDIVTGLSVGEGKRGRIFGVIGSALGLGQFIGGLVAGPLVDHGGFELMFTALGGFYILLTLVTLFVADKPLPARSKTATQAKVSLGLPFMLLFVAAVIIGAANFSTGITRPLVMDLQGFDLSAIASAMAISGLVNLPLPFLMGWVSDRTGRRATLVACYVLGAMGLGMLLFSSALWHFWVAQTLISVMTSTYSVGAALVTDVLPREHLNTGMSRYSATRWIGAMLSFVGVGFAIQAIGLDTTIVLSVALALLAIPLVLATRPSRQPTALVPAASGAA